MIVRNVNICVRGFFSQNTLQFFKVSRFCLVVEGIEMYLVKKKTTETKLAQGHFSAHRFFCITSLPSTPV